MPKKITTKPQPLSAGFLAKSIAIATLTLSSFTAQAYDAFNGTLDRTETISGIDANNNGIRDDIEAFIVQRYAEPKERAAMMQFARSVQASLLVDKFDQSALQALSLKDSYAVNCVFNVLNPERNADNGLPEIAAREIVSLTTNTKARSKAYLMYSYALSGFVLTFPNGNTCD